MSDSASLADAAQQEKHMNTEHKSPASSIKEQAPPPNPPEGGSRAWMAVAGGSAGMFISLGWVNCVGLFQAYYQENELRQYSSSEVAWITSTEFFLLLGFSPLAGTLFDNYGPTLPLAIGSFMHVFGLMMASLSTRYYEFILSQSICSGIGTSLIFGPSMMAPQTFFRAKRGIAGGLTSLGSSLGGVIFPLMVQHLLPQIGFGWTMRVCAFLVLALACFAILVIRSNLEHKPRPFDVMNYIRPLGETNFAILCVGTFFLYWGFIIPLNDLVIVAERYGVATGLAVSLVPILNGSSSLGRTVPNFIADKIGRFNVMCFMTIISAILCLALWLPGRGNGASIAFAVLFGISSGAVIGLGPVLVVMVSPMHEIGTRMGTMVAFAAVACLTSPPIANAISAAAGGTYVYTSLLAGLNLVIASACLGAIRVRLGGLSLASKV